jgi:hypothetical protein
MCISRNANGVAVMAVGAEVFWEDGRTFRQCCAPVPISRFEKMRIESVT